jgi:hypothetical protein
LKYHRSISYRLPTLGLGITLQTSYTWKLKVARTVCAAASSEPELGLARKNVMSFGRGWLEKGENRFYLLLAVSREEENHVHRDSLPVTLD